MATFDPLAILTERFTHALRQAFPELAGTAEPLISASRQPQFGDFQSNAAMPLAKKIGANPRQIAMRLIEHLDVADIAEPLTEASIAGPGFINIRLKSSALADLLTHFEQASLGLEPVQPPLTVVVDVCGVNLAKQMHVGHIRSTVIGDTIARLFERLGHHVMRQNHVGDWGLPIAMVTDRLLRTLEANQQFTLTDLDTWYKAAQAACRGEHRASAFAARHGANAKLLAELDAINTEADENLASAKRTLVALQSGDPRVRAMWQRIYDITMQECMRACVRLHTRITLEHSAGESSYADELAPIVDDLLNRKVAEVSDGAVIVRVEGIGEPCIIRKRDGGFLYATTDIAAIRRRVQQLKADLVVYCVDIRQSLHFKQVFGAAVRAGYAQQPDRAEPAHLQHAAFGTILGDDGAPFKTRSGENVRLSDLLDEAIERATAAVRERSRDLSPVEQTTVAEAVGIAAIKYADLSNDRVKDYTFNYDRMLAFEGNTGPYLLYALVRVRSIFRKASEQNITLDPKAVIIISEPEEKTLALELLRYPKVVQASADALEPHRLCAYLFDLASAYSAFFDRCPVLRADSVQLQASRLRLCSIVASVLADGLDVLGLPTVERM
ncbi:MAG: arginine--tRNA ligase [Phycisphaeraceae bacterium]|nr:arginine--tRNA ligase [Phycisphaeraceae bacterium]MCW5762695.1 arginine--tRNA ligase [Phycisphaeraceae bacterium]